MSIFTRSSKPTEPLEARRLAEAEARLAGVRAEPPPVDGGVAGLNSGLVGPEAFRLQSAEAEVDLARRKLAEAGANTDTHARLVRAELAQARAEAATTSSPVVKRLAEDDASYWTQALREAEAEVQRYAEPTAS
ncbi:hypothetical protein BH23CHL8_BH23CHL8_30990 [soil metagenome]